MSVKEVSEGAAESHEESKDSLPAKTAVAAGGAEALAGVQ